MGGGAVCPQFGNNCGQICQKVLNLGLGVVEAQTEADAAAGTRGAEVHCGQNMGGIEGTGGAGGAAGSADARLVQQ